MHLQWRHNGLNGVSNHQHHQCLLRRLFGRRSKKTLKLRVTGLCAGNPPGNNEFPTKRTSNAENVSIWWRHHVNYSRCQTLAMRVNKQPCWTHVTCLALEMRSISKQKCRHGTIIIHLATKRAIGMPGACAWACDNPIALSEKKVMMTSSNENISPVTGPLCGEFTGDRWIPLTKASDAERWCFLWSTPE